MMLGKYILAVLLGYGVGCFSSAYFLSKTLKKGDIRKYGSGNAGTTNMLRTYGFGFGIATLLMDILKGILAIVVGYLIGGEECALLSGLFAVVGHIFPFYLGFKGGKGVATTLGVIIAVNPLVGFLLFAMGLVIVLLTQMVSLASLAIVIMFPIICLVLYPTRLMILVVAIFLMLITLYKHRENINRIRRGTENKVDIIAKIKNK